jgi:hypothetical protein
MAAFEIRIISVFYMTWEVMLKTNENKVTIPFSTETACTV